MCFHIPNVCRKHHWWYAALHDRALLRSYTLVLHCKCSKMSQDSHGQTGDAKSGPSLGSSSVFVSMSTMCAERLSRVPIYMRTGTRASTQTRWCRCSAPGNPADWHLNSEHLNANLPSVLHLILPLWNSFVFTLFILNRRKEIQHLRKLIVT